MIGNTAQRLRFDHLETGAKEEKLQEVDGRRDLDSSKTSKQNYHKLKDARGHRPELCGPMENTNHTDNQEFIFTQVNRFLVIPRNVDGKEATASATRISLTR